jgi:serine/threonine protein kinase
MMGTPNYMAPELCEAPVDDTPAADVFALGVTLYLLLTGRLPYPEGTAKQVVQRRRTDDAADLNRVRGDWVNGLPELVSAMTDPDPTNRPRAKQLVNKLIALQILTMRKQAG